MSDSHDEDPDFPRGSVSPRPYEERLRLAVFRMVELLDHAISFEDPSGSVPKFREELRALANEGPPILGQMAAKVTARSSFALPVPRPMSVRGDV